MNKIRRRKRERGLGATLWIVLAVIVFAIYVASRPTLDWLDGILVKPTERERYLKELVNERNPRWNFWESAYLDARLDSTTIQIPARERIQTDTAALRSAQSWRIDVPTGRRVELEIINRDSVPLFAELFVGEESRPEQNVEVMDTMRFEFEDARAQTAVIQLVVQSRLGATNDYEIALHDRAVLRFPVAEKTERAIKSFWGDPRDGGRRKHKGNDIFAPKGTPLLAVTEGRISRVRNGGLGGKSVFLRDGEGRPLSYYYAHLDSQYVRRGQYVERGDTIGTVGNTGNARTTPPHLHFGIYGRGAIDPNAFLRDPQRAPERAIALRTEPWIISAREPYYLRYQPTRKNSIIRQLEAGEVVHPLGRTGRFTRVRTARGETGYVLM